MPPGVILITALLLGLWVSQDKAQPKVKTTRDLSTPATRLVGRWKGAETAALSECEFFGPIDSATKTGDFRRYRLTGRDKKTDQQVWKQFNFKFQVLSEDSTGDRVTVNLLFADGKTSLFFVNNPHLG